MGIVAKKFLETINAAILKETALNQWRSTATVIDWFRDIPDKHNSRFIKFDIAEFYPSISENLLDNAVNYARGIIPVTEDVLAIIKQARASLLFDKCDTWIKKGSNPMFDVTMGSFDGAEICELIGLYLLDKLSNLIGKDQIGLYRDDGLAVIYNQNGPQLDRLRKDIIALFKAEGLSITIEATLSVTEFLDVTLDLNTGKYYPFRKPNDTPIYINASSNHPPSIVKQLPRMVNERISALSYDQEEFAKAKKKYESALKSSGFHEQMEFKGAQTNKTKVNRKRKILWFNPPFSQQVKTNIGKIFLKLVRKHFPKSGKLKKIFSSNTIKLSYSCTTNMENIIKQHNSKVLSDTCNTEVRLCNCRDRSKCPMEGKCLTKCIIYRAEVEANDTKATYYGLCEDTFKARYNNHTKSFRLKKYENETELSKHIWKLKDNATDYVIRWNVASRASPYKCGTRRCDLCLSEKVCIVRSEPRGLLNKRTELISKCRHRNKFLLNGVNR